MKQDLRPLWAEMDGPPRTRMASRKWHPASSRRVAIHPREGPATSGRGPGQVSGMLPTPSPRTHWEPDGSCRAPGPEYKWTCPSPPRRVRGAGRLGGRFIEGKKDAAPGVHERHASKGASPLAGFHRVEGSPRLRRQRLQQLGKLCELPCCLVRPESCSLPVVHTTSLVRSWETSGSHLPPPDIKPGAQDQADAEAAPPESI